MITIYNKERYETYELYYRFITIEKAIKKAIAYIRNKLNKWRFYGDNEITIYRHNEPVAGFVFNLPKPNKRGRPKRDITEVLQKMFPEKSIDEIEEFINPPYPDDDY
jgi:hypothetical protein